MVGELQMDKVEIAFAPNIKGLFLPITRMFSRAGGSSYRLVRPILYNTAKNNHCAFTLVIIVLQSIKDNIYKVTGQKLEEFTMREHQRNKPKCLRCSSLAVVNSLRIAIWFNVSVKCL